MSVGSAFAKYISTLGAGSFELHLAPIERAYIVYSEDDNSLEIFKGLDIPEVGEKSRTNKTVTKVYHDRLEYTKYTITQRSGAIVVSESVIPAWHEIASKVTSIKFFDEVSPISTAGWFYGFSNITSIDLSKLDTSRTTDMSGMFFQCTGLTSLDLSSLDTSEVTNMASMFKGCSNLSNITFGGKFNTSKVTEFGSMFEQCAKLTNLDLTSFNTQNVTSMVWMFNGCSKLSTVDLSSFNTATVSAMSGMFYGCNKLTTVYASNEFVTTSVTKSGDMFRNCSSLVGGNGTKLSSGKIDKTYARIDGANGLHGYFTAKDDTTVTYANVTLTLTSTSYSWQFTNTKQKHFFINDANSITLTAEEGVTLPTEVTLTCGDNSETATVTTAGVVVIPAAFVIDGETITIATPSEDATGNEENSDGTETASNEQESPVSEETTSPEDIATDPVLPPSEGSEDTENGTEQTEGQQDQE